jgi:acyl-CoA synthetase (AMP-forming)/AMP-acid ligase II
MGKIYSIIERNTKKFPKKTALIKDNGKVLSNACLVDYVDWLAARLAAVFSRGSKVFLISKDSYINITSVLALNKIGCCIIPLNPSLHNAQVLNFFERVGADGVVTDQVGLLNVFDDCTDICFVTETEITLRGNKIFPVKDLRNQPYKKQSEFLITFSSGSTSNPKPIIFTEQNKISRFKQSRDTFEVIDSDVILCASPFHHSLGQRLSFLSLLAGCTLVQLDNFSTAKWLNAVGNYNVSLTIPVSTHLHALAEKLLAGHELQTKSLRTLVSSSAGIAAELKSSLIRKGGFDFCEMYGASEIATATVLRSDDVGKEMSVGKALSGVEVVIVGPDGETVANGTTGEIWVKTIQSSPGYFGDETLTENSFVNGYFKTGDIGWLDGDGFLYFVSRLNDVIGVGGLNVFPRDVQDVVLSLDEVSECVVVGLPDKMFGELVVAFVISQSKDKNSVEKILRQHCRQHLASYQQPAKYIFIDEMPYLSSGKIDSNGLRALLTDVYTSASDFVFKK